MDAFAAFETLADDSPLARVQSDKKKNDNELHHAKSLQELIQLEVHMNLRLTKHFVDGASVFH